MEVPIILCIVVIVFLLINHKPRKKPLTSADILDMKLNVMQKAHEQEMALMDMKMYCEDKKDVVCLVTASFLGGVIVYFTDGTDYNTNDGGNFEDVIKQKREEMKLNEVKV